MKIKRIVICSEFDVGPLINENEDGTNTTDLFGIDFANGPDYYTDSNGFSHKNPLVN